MTESFSIPLNEALNNFARTMGIDNDSWAPKECPNCGCTSYRDLSTGRREWDCLSTFENKTYGDKVPYLCQNVYHCNPELVAND